MIGHRPTVGCDGSLPANITTQKKGGNWYIRLVTTGSQLVERRLRQGGEEALRACLWRPGKVSRILPTEPILAAQWKPCLLPSDSSNLCSCVSAGGGSTISPLVGQNISPLLNDRWPLHAARQHNTCFTGWMKNLMLARSTALDNTTYKPDQQAPYDVGNAVCVLSKHLIPRLAQGISGAILLGTPVVSAGHQILPIRPLSSPEIHWVFCQRIWCHVPIVLIHYGIFCIT